MTTADNTMLSSKASTNKLDQLLNDYPKLSWVGRTAIAVLASRLAEDDMNEFDLEEFDELAEKLINEEISLDMYIKKIAHAWAELVGFECTQRYPFYKAA